MCFFQTIHIKQNGCHCTKPVQVVQIAWMKRNPPSREEKIEDKPRLRSDFIDQYVNTNTVLNTIKENPDVKHIIYINNIGIKNINQYMLMWTKR